MDDFSRFKPICVAVLKTPSVEKINDLKLLIDQSEAGSLDQLQEYILFPLFIITSNGSVRNEKLMIAVGNCLEALCQKSTVKVYKIFGDFMLQLLLVVDDIQPDESKRHHSSEELKLSAVKSITALLKSASHNVISELINENNKPLMGHLIFTLLKITANEEMKELRLSALDSLLVLSTKPDDSLATCLTGFFPGICTHMLKTINGSVKQPHIVTKNGVKVFAQFIALVMNDQRFSDDQDKNGLSQTQKNLHSILEKVLNNPELHWMVKLELISMIALLAENCSVTLEPTLSLLIKKLVQFTADERAEVVERASEVIQSLSHSRVYFDPAVRQNLYDVVTCLPRIVSQGITRDQLLVLQELQGHLTLLGPRLEQSLMFSGLRHRLFKGLLLSAALEPAKVMERDEPYTLQYLREDSVVEAFGSCCSAIGRFGNLGDTADYLLDVLRQRNSRCSESVFIMSHIIKSADLDVSVLSTIAQDYSSCLTTLEANREDALLGQLLLTAIGDVALRMETKFTSILLTVLKPVLEKAGHPDFSKAGLSALESIAKSLGLESLSALLEKNADYFAPQLSFQLRNIARYPRAIDLLRALLLLSDIRMDHWLERMVQQALKGLDKSHTVRALPYVQVLELYSRAAHRARPAGPACAKPLARDEEAILEEQTRRMEEYDFFVKSSEPKVEDEDERPMDEEEETEEWVEEPVPPQVALVADILDRCTQLLPQCHEEQLYSSLMSTIHQSIDVLWFRENLFLPKVHLLWDPLKTQLLFASSPLKQRQAVGVLSLLIRRCPDFVRQRVVTEVVPKLITLLENQSRASIGRAGRAHVSSQGYKLQKAVLSEMAGLVEFLDPPADRVYDIIGVVTLYLSRRQISELQNLAKESLTLIGKYHPEAVRSTLLKSKDENPEFTTNVQEVLRRLKSSS